LNDYIYAGIRALTLIVDAKRIQTVRTKLSHSKLRLPVT
jgi:hypothetical protein